MNSYKLFRYLKIVFISLLFISLFISYNINNIFYNNWFMHPDDHGDWIISENLFKNGRFTYKEPLNKIGEYQLFVPSGTKSNIEGEILPSKSFGSYIFFSFGFLIGDLYPFFLISFFGILSILFFFLLTRELFGEKTAFISTFLLGFSFPMIYWSNMFFSNIISFFFFIMATYLLVKINKTPNKFYLYLLCFFIFSLSFFVRYEYLFFILILFPLYFNNELKRKYVLVGLLIMLIFIIHILVLNYMVFKAPFSMGATSISPSAQNEVTSNPLIKLIQIYFVHLIVPDTDFITNNFDLWVYRFFEPLFPLILLQIILLSKERKNFKYWLPFLIITLFWGYYVLNATYWGAGTEWLGTSYSRYLLVPYSFLIILCSKFLVDFSKRNKTSRIISIVLLLLITFNQLLSVNSMLWSGKYGLTDTIEEKEFYFNINRIADSLPENSIIVGNLVPKAIIAKKVLNYDELVDVAENNSIVYFKPISKEKKNSVVQSAIKTLIQEGYIVYIIEVPWHDKTYINLRGDIEKNIQTWNITIKKIDKPVKFKNNTINLYKLNNS